MKFVLNKLDPQSPEKEYSLCINFDKDRYNCELKLLMRFCQLPLLIPHSPFFTFFFVTAVLQCDPHIKDVEKLVKDLNLSDNVVKFVRIIREKFQSSAMNGNQ